MAQTPLPPLAPKEVGTKLAYITVTLKASAEFLKVDLGHVTSSKMQVYKDVMIAPYNREAIVGQSVKLPSKCLKQAGCHSVKIMRSPK